MPGGNNFELEELRIKTAYARRACFVPPDRYSMFTRGHLFLIQQLEQQMLALLRRHGCDPLETKKILEVGCGTGSWLRQFIRWGARPENMTGIDLLPNLVAEAKRLCPATVTIDCGNAATLDYPSAAFDLVLQATVFTSILDPSMRGRVAAEMLRVVKEDGIILWYDYYVDNPWNPDVRGVKKREIYQLFPNCQIELSRITLVPPLARLLAPYSWLACYCLSKIPWLCTHYLGAIRRQGAVTGRSGLLG